MEELKEKVIRLNKIRRNLVIVFIIILLFTTTLIIKYITECEEEAYSRYHGEPPTMYNAKVSKYVGDSKKGSDVKLLIEEIISQNNKNVGEKGKFISVHNGTKPQYSSKQIGGRKNKIESFNTEKNGCSTEKLLEACQKANSRENPEGENTQENIDEATRQMRAFEQKISAGKNYKVEAVEYEDTSGLDEKIYAVYISTLDADNTNTQNTTNQTSEN